MTHITAFMKTLRARPVLIALIVLLILLALSGAGYAISRSLGYTANTGVVQGTPPLVIQSTSQPFSATTSRNESEGANPISLSISKVIDAGDSYILSGWFTPLMMQNSLDHSIKIIDANGAEVLWVIPNDIEPEFSDSSEFWAAQFAKEQAYPVHLEYSELLVTLDPSKTESYEFEFDAGTDSQIGQVWELNHEIRFTGYDFSLLSISVQESQDGDGCQDCRYNYTIDFDMPEIAQMIRPMPMGFPGLNPPFDTGAPFQFPDGAINILAFDLGGKTIAGSMGQTILGKWEIDGPHSSLLSGRTRIRIFNLPGSSETNKWALDWQPDGYMLSTGSTPTSQPCLTAKTWKAALANPDPIPTNLNGKVSASLMNEDLSSFHISISNLDGSDQVNYHRHRRWL